MYHAGTKILMRPVALISAKVVARVKGWIGLSEKNQAARAAGATGRSLRVFLKAEITR